MENQETFSIFPEVTVVYASFWERFAASFLDGLILAIPNLTITYLITGSIIKTELVSTIITTIIGWLYCALLESGENQATLGKRAMNIKVTNMEGGRASFMQATGRHFGKWVSTIIIFIGYFMMLWDDKKQTLHDKMAGTLVVGK